MKIITRALVVFLLITVAWQYFALRTAAAVNLELGVRLAVAEHKWLEQEELLAAYRQYTSMLEWATSYYEALLERKQERADIARIARIIERINAKAPAKEIAEALLPVAKRYELDADLLLAQAWTESHFRNDLRGGHGEVGLMQVRPDLWVDKLDFVDTAEELGDLRLNIEAGAWILAKYIEKYGSVHNGLRAYNGWGGTKYAPLVLSRYQQIKKWGSA